MKKLLTKKEISLYSDLMLTDLVAGKPNINDIDFKITIAGVDYQVYYMRDINVSNPQWHLADYKVV